MRFAPMLRRLMVLMPAMPALTPVWPVCGVVLPASAGSCFTMSITWVGAISAMSSALMTLTGVGA